MTSTLNFPRFLLPAFPRWESSLVKRHRPVEDVTASVAVASAARSRPSTASSAVTTSSEEREDPPARHARILSHDSGCIISDDDEEGEGEEVDDEAEQQNYTSASSSSNSLEIYLDTESGYGGSSDEISNISPSSSVPRQLPTSQKPRKRSHFWSRKSTSPQVVAPPKPTLSTTTTYLTCSTCHTHLCFSSSIISKGFTGRHGRAYLVTNLIPANIVHGKPTSRALQTGAHTVSDISCKICGATLGWKYVHAEERSQRYKIGKYILETGRVGRINHWDGDAVPAFDERKNRDDKNRREGWEPGWETLGDEEIDVDLADEEELEEMFAGTWNKDKAGRRRERRKQIEDIRRKVDSNV